MDASARRSATRSMLESCGALIQDDHFVYASGEHGPGWIAKDIINMDPTRPRDLGAMLAEAVRETNIEFDLVCGPAIGGVICAQYTALALDAECVFAERVRVDGVERFELKRRYDEAVAGRRVLVVDDVINTGHSTGLVVESVRAAGGEVVGGFSGALDEGHLVEEGLGPVPLDEGASAELLRVKGTLDP